MSHPRMLEAQSAIDKAQRDLAHATIVAPWSGTVANVENLRSGAYVTAGQPALSLVASDDLWVEANPKETDLTHLKVGDRRDRKRRCLSLFQLEGEGHERESGNGRGILRAAAPECIRQLGEGGAARAGEARPRGGIGRTAAHFRHERRCLDRHRPSPQPVVVVRRDRQRASRRSGITSPKMISRQINILAAA